ncbi:MAG: DUF4286 family protein [Bacteroidaceae bacterium]|nr:DUF4286 family protein [Bacteroidaceae bacterium]
MIVFNTTYTMPTADARHFVIWVHQSLFPRTAEDGALCNPRLLRVLSHHDQETECFSVQFQAESTAELHRWFNRLGNSLNQELLRVFDGRIVGFTTLLEEIMDE